MVDVQNDFCPGGALPVPGGNLVADRISEYLSSHPDSYDIVVASMDWHPGPVELPEFEHFSKEPDFQTTWPPHCVKGTVGAELHPDLVLPEDTAIVHKGQRSAAYSAFEGRDAQGRTLSEILARQNVDRIDVVGLATDYCVAATAKDASRQGLDVRVPRWATAGVAEESTNRALEEMRACGIDIVEGELES